jgi:serine/threonine protein kinase
MRAAQVVICDFGLAHTNSTSAAATATVAAQLAAPEPGSTLKYTSPERSLPEQSFAPSFEDDVYAFGVLMFFIATSETPFKHIPPALLLDAIRHGTRPQGLEAWVKKAPSAHRRTCEGYMHLAQECWQPSPGNRPSFESILSRLTALCRVVEACPVQQSATNWAGRAALMGGLAGAVVVYLLPIAWMFLT